MIHLHQNSMEISILSPYNKIIQVEELPVLKNENYFPFKPFDEKIIFFFDDFSKSILSNKAINKIAEITALAFWLRKQNLMRIKNENSHLYGDHVTSQMISPRGIVFHVCPANVDTMFMYSMAISFLAGNKNILRISKRMNAPHILMLFDVLNETLERFPEFIEYNNIVTYGHDDQLSTFISQRVAARVIWGGDQTIKLFKKFETLPRCKDICFPDRISISCIDSREYNSLEGTELDVFAKKFYNDAYTFDQKGCSSPQSIFLIGDKEENDQCLQNLQSRLSDYILHTYQCDTASIASLKLNYMVDELVKGNKFTKSGDNIVTFLLKENAQFGLNHTCGGGIFYVYMIERIAELAPWLVPKLQTISYFKLAQEDISELEHLANGIGIDRIVPMGTALDFSYIWDGYNLFDELSKKVFVN